ncbi:MAG: hypothetical protein KOO61_04745 [Spirochaetales bacterium]|nr:hypothetical protein [Spirochaetales bacterium]
MMNDRFRLLFRQGTDLQEIEDILVFAIAEAEEMLGRDHLAGSATYSFGGGSLVCELLVEGYAGRVIMGKFVSLLAEELGAGSFLVELRGKERRSEFSNKCAL